MKVYAITLVTLGALTSFTGCNGNDNSSPAQASGTIDQTSQFLSTTGDQRFTSNGMSLHFGSDASFEMILNDQTLVPPSSSAQCNIRMNGSSAYYQQKSITVNGQQEITGPILQLTPAKYQVISSKINYTPPGSTLTADSICNQYAQDLMATKVLQLSVVEYASDHLTLGEIQDFGIPQADLSKKTSQSIWMNEEDTLGMTAENRYFVRDGGSLDITTSFLGDFSDSSYTTDPATAPKTEAALTLDAGLKEMTFDDSRCGLKYIIDIDSIKTTGGTPLLRGTIADSVVAIPSNENDQSTNGILLMKCSDMQEMIEGVSTQGIEISGIQNMCTDNSCTSFYADLRIGKPGTLTATSSMDSIMLSFQSATVGSVR